MRTDQMQSRPTAVTRSSSRRLRKREGDPSRAVAFPTERNHNVLLAVGHVGHRSASCAYWKIEFGDHFTGRFVEGAKLGWTGDSGLAHHSVARIADEEQCLGQHWSRPASVAQRRQVKTLQ